MKGKCKYCGEELPYIANIRCDKCNKVFVDGMKLGSEIIQEKIRNSIKLFMNIANGTYSQ